MYEYYMCTIMFQGKEFQENGLVFFRIADSNHENELVFFPYYTAKFFTVCSYLIIGI